MTLKPRLGVTQGKVIETDTNRSATYDFLLTLHSNHGPISHRLREKREFQSKIANFSHTRVFCAPLTGYPLELCINARGQTCRMMEIPEGQNSFKIGLAV